MTSASAFASIPPSMFKHCINGDADTNAQNGSEPILCVNVNLTVILTQTQMQTLSVNKA